MLQILVRLLIAFGFSEDTATSVVGSAVGGNRDRSRSPKLNSIEPRIVGIEIMKLHKEKELSKEPYCACLQKRTTGHYS